MTDEPRTDGGTARAAGRRRLLARVPWTAVLATVLLAGALVVPGPSGVRPTAVAAGYGPDGAPEPGAASGWIRTWQASPQPPAQTLLLDGPQSVTVRMRLRTSAGGRAARFTLSNLYGQSGLGIAAVSVGRAVVPAAGVPVSAAPSAAQPGTLRAVTFSGLTGTVIPAGGVVVSDPVTMDVPALTDLVVSVAYTDRPRGLTGHVTPVATSRLAAGGDLTTDVGATAFGTTFTGRVTLTAIDVLPDAGRQVPVVVTFGDSITDGARSTRDADRRWPDALADATRTVAVANAGIGGNRLLLASADGGDSAAARLERDALDVPGARVVVVLEGVNDVRRGASRDAVVGALTDLGRRARARGLVVVMGTLTPFDPPRKGGVSDGERVRQQVNAWIRDQAVRDGAADSVADVARAVQSPDDPSTFARGLDSGDHLHPNDEGYATIAATFEPAIRAAVTGS